MRKEIHAGDLQVFVSQIRPPSRLIGLALSRCLWVSSRHVQQSVIKFSSESWPDWLRNSLWVRPSLTFCHTIDIASDCVAELNAATARTRLRPDANGDLGRI